MAKNNTALDNLIDDINDKIIPDNIHTVNVLFGNYAFKNYGYPKAKLKNFYSNARKGIEWENRKADEISDKIYYTTLVFAGINILSVLEIALSTLIKIGSNQFSLGKYLVFGLVGLGGAVLSGIGIAALSKIEKIKIARLSKRNPYIGRDIKMQNMFSDYREALSSILKDGEEIVFTDSIKEKVKTKNIYKKN